MDTPLPEEQTSARRWRSGIAALRAAGRGLVDMLYPPLCLACTTVVGTPGSLCPQCWRGMRFIARPYCERLGTPFAVDIGGPLLSPAAIADPPVFDKARAVAIHDGTARELVQRLKYNDRTELAPALAAMMAWAGAEVIASADVICPVPLHWTRAFRRRFNQSGLLARYIARLSARPLVADLVTRRKRTRQQVGLSRNQRRENLQGAFVVRPERKADVAGRRVLLIDDVLTTGATANAAARALLRAGATQVDILTFSRVVPGM
jgi:ComF family protein